MTTLSAIASLCLERQLREALDLTVTCRMLSDSFRAAEEPLLAVVLSRLSEELSDQFSVLLPLTDGVAGLPPDPDPSPTVVAIDADADIYLPDLGARLGRAALVAHTDAMEPGLEPAVAAVLRAVAALYRARRELLLLCSVVNSP
jgi:hypothetical protein